MLVFRGLTERQNLRPLREPTALHCTDELELEKS